MEKIIIDVHVETLLLFTKDMSHEEALHRLHGMRAFGQFTREEYLVAINKAIEIIEDRVVNNLLVGDPD